MAKRKLNIPKAKQIKGLRKAIANQRTPRQFLPSLRKRLARLTAAVAILFVLCGCAARPAVAQTPVIIQPTQQILAPSGTACTGSAQTFPVNNKNQTQHYANLKSGGGITNLVMIIQGLDSSGNAFQISDTAAIALPIVGANASLSGSGYFPTVQVVVTCFPASTGTFALNYSGGQAISPINVGSYLITQLDKTISSFATAGTTYSAAIQTPFGNAYGVIYFQFAGTGPSGSQLNIQCETQESLGPNVYTYNLVTTSATNQIFAVPPTACPNMTVQYLPGGASASQYDFDYVFLPPGSTVSNSYSHIASTTAAIIKPGPGIVHSITVNTPAAGTVSLFDLASTSCSGTPASNVVAVVTVTTTFPSASLIYDVQLSNGICVKASSSSIDFTVGYQ